MLIRSDQSLSRVQLFATPGIAAHQASLSITNSRSSLRLTSIESVMPSSHLILCHSLLLLPSIFPSIRVFSNESALCIRWPKYWSFSFSISPSKEHPGLISFRMSFSSSKVPVLLPFTVIYFQIHNSEIVSTNHSNPLIIATLYIQLPGHFLLSFQLIISNVNSLIVLLPS